MGESKRKKQQQTDLLPELRVAVEKAASAVRKLALAASGQLGGDCYIHSEIGQQLLADQGIKATLVSGYAAWRVGPGDGDVISHTLQTQSYLPSGAQGMVYHVWLESCGHVIDLTTYQLSRKAAELDALDGGHTVVEWRPLYLFLPRDQIRSYREVAMALNEGVAYYEADASLMERLRQNRILDPSDLSAARLLMANPELNVMGPNQFIE